LLFLRSYSMARAFRSQTFEVQLVGNPRLD
jgi:hypothetical protein